jgi:hypothetical protein
MSFSVKRVLLHVLLPLLIGFFIYFFFRPDVAFIQWFSKREPLIPLNQLNKVQELFVFSGPDFCWSYSLSSALFIGEKWQVSSIRYFAFIVLLLVIGAELIQLLLTSAFTPDWIDVLAALSAFILSYFLIRRPYNEK